MFSQLVKKRMYHKINKLRLELNICIENLPRSANATKECKRAWMLADETVDSTTRDAFTPRGDFHAMDCTDIVIGFYKDGLSRVVDSYTR